MTPNPLKKPASQSAFSDHRSTARAGMVFWKTGAAPALVPLRISEKPKVALQGISVTYGVNGSRLFALDNIELRVRAGEFLCSAAAWGCSKSSLLQLIAA